MRTTEMEVVRHIRREWRKARRESGAIDGEAGWQPDETIELRE